MEFTIYGFSPSDMNDVIGAMDVVVRRSPSRLVWPSSVASNWVLSLGNAVMVVVLSCGFGDLTVVADSDCVVDGDGWVVVGISGGFGNLTVVEDST